MARSPPPCAHDDARLRLPAAPPPQNSEAGKKESMDRRLNQACRPSATPWSRSSLNCHRNDARTVENGLVSRSGVSKSAKVVLGRIAQSTRPLGSETRRRPPPQGTPTSRPCGCGESSLKAHGVVLV